jgi:CTP synthase (UTP-ammonia lyase)
VRSISIGIIGDYDERYVSHPQTGAAVVAAGRRLGVDVSYEWAPTPSVGGDVRILDRFDGLWMSPGSPYQSLDGALAGIRFARERGKPFVGT